LAIGQERQEKVQIARILGRTFKTPQGSLAPLALAAIVLVAAPQYTSQQYLGDAGSTAVGDYRWPLRGGLMLLSTATAALLHGLVIRVCLDRLLERDVSVGEAIATVLPRTVSLIAVGILTGILVALGAFLLLIPGIILYIGWSVASAAVIQEGLSTVPAMKRSWQLTRGNRWRIFWLFALAGILYLLALGGAALAVQSSAGGGAASAGAIAIQAAIMAFVELFAGSLKASLYFELRSASEGHPSEALAAVFE
jgi:hypothetical protein